MPERSCSTCKYFEPSSVPGKGWCRNPMLYAPQQSHQVKQDTLDCKGRFGHFWEPASGVPSDFGGTASSDEALTQRRRLRLFQPPPQLVPATAGGIMASSSRGGGGDFENYDNPRPSGRGSGGGSGGSRGNEPPPPGGTGVNRRGLPQGQERTVSYQPEERYWTDYLRIALPVVGLLLMLGLFWYWASAVIGDDGDKDTTPTAVQGLVITATAPPATNTPEVNIAAETVTVEATDDTSENGSNNDDDPTETPEEEDTPEPAGKGFEVGEFVVTNSGDVNLREDKSTESDALDSLAEGVELTVIEAATEEGQGGYFWVGVRTSGGQEGYIADILLEPSE